MTPAKPPSEPLEFTIFVSPGSAGTGSVGDPVGTLVAARDAARASGKLGRMPVTIRLGTGVHSSAETLVLGPEDSGSAVAPVKWIADGEAVCSGAGQVYLSWTHWQSGVYRAKLSPDVISMLGAEGTDQLYVGGVRQPMARFPNRVSGKSVYDAWDLTESGQQDPESDCLSPERVAHWANPAGAYVHAMHDALWGDMHYRVKGVKPDGTLDLEGGWQNNRPSRMHGRFRYVENVLEELDSPGEWYFDHAGNTVYFMPPAGIDLTRDPVAFVRLRHLIELRGTGDNPVRHVHFHGITFRHACRTFMDNREPLLRSDWTTYRGGAVLLTGVEDISFNNCTFEDLGGNALFVSGYAQRLQVRGCLFREIGGNGIAFVGSADAVQSPLFNYDERGDFAKMSRTPGPKSSEYPRDCLVEDCLLTRTGRDEKQSAPVQISMAQRITVRQCSIYGVPRAGINISEGTWGGHVVEYCDVFDTVLETGDHGSFNSWGRDRFWAPEREVVEERVAKEPGLPLLDVTEPITLRYSRWRCDHGWDIDLDDGSTNYQIYGNLLLNGGLKLREGYRRTAENNVIVNNSLHPHVWYEGSGDVFRHNIVMGAYLPAGGMPATRWGAEVDHNFYVASEGARRRFAAVGCDAHSICGEPRFVDASASDFRVSDASPARQTGFTGWSFAPTEYGVQSPRLRSIARTPVIPEVLRHPSSEQASIDPLTYYWIDCAIRDLVGNEYSAYGTLREAPGVLVTKVTDGGKGLAKHDLIVELNGSPVSSVAELVRVLGAAIGSERAPATTGLVVLRNQKRMAVTVDGTVRLPML